MGHRRGLVLACATVIAVGTTVDLRTAQADDAPFDERGGNVFFTEPDAATAKRIGELLSRFSSGSVSDRTRWRHELEEIGYWSVAPIIEALEEGEPPVQSASALALGAILDPRAREPLREAMERETSHPYVSGFSAVALARYRDAESVPHFQRALRSSKSMHILRAAAPYALARIGTPEAGALLAERLRHAGGNVHVRSARLLALGFFPQRAVVDDGFDPSPVLRKGMREGRRELRRAALLAYIVATLSRNDTQPVLEDFIDREDASDVLVPALLGLSRYENIETTERLARIASRPGDDDVRQAAAELLVPRRDPAALEGLQSIIRKSSSDKLRATAIIAIGGIDGAGQAVIERLNDKDALVRAASAVAATRLVDPALRQEALRRIDTRIRKTGESSRAVRATLDEARRVLEGGDAPADWGTQNLGRFFSGLFESRETKLLRVVNRAVEESLDLGKIHNLQTDEEIVVGGEQDGDSGGDEGGEGGDAGDGGETETPDDSPTPGEESPGVDGNPEPKTPPTSAASAGAARTSQWQELRDLKVELRRRPLFGPADLPRAPATR